MMGTLKVESGIAFLCFALAILALFKRRPSEQDKTSVVDIMHDAGETSLLIAFEVPGPAKKKFTPYTVPIILIIFALILQAM